MKEQSIRIAIPFRLYERLRERSAVMNTHGLPTAMVMMMEAQHINSLLLLLLRVPSPVRDPTAH